MFFMAEFHLSQVKKKKTYIYYWKKYHFLVSMHKVGMRLIHTQTAILNSFPKPKWNNLYDFLTIFYKELQHSDL